MLRVFTLVFAGFFTATALAGTDEEPSAPERWNEDGLIIFDAEDINLNDFLWIARPVVIFADSVNDPRFQEQLRFVQEVPEAVTERDILIVTDTNPNELSDLRKRLRPRGFMLAILGKDGGVKLRKPFPWDMREIGRVIDKMPLRQQELREQRQK